MIDRPNLNMMRDRNVVGWVLSQVSLARRNSDSEQAEGYLALLTQEVVERWLKQGNGHLATRLLEELPDEAVAPFADYLLNNWEVLADALAAQALIRLAGTVPDRVLELVETRLCRNRATTPHRLWGAARALERIGPDAVPVLSRLLHQRGRTIGAHRLQWTGLLKAAAVLNLPGLAPLVRAAVTDMSTEVLDIQALLEDVYHALAPGQPFMDMLFDIELRRCGYRFEDLPELFSDEANLQELDGLAESGGPEKMARAVDLLKRLKSTLPVCRFAVELAAELPESSPRTARQMVYLFLLAAAAASYARHDFEVEGKELQHLLDVLTCDITHVPHERTIAQAIIDNGDEDKMEVLHRELDEARFYRGAPRLLGVLARLNHPSSIEPVIACLADGVDDETAHAAVAVLARHGERALEALTRRWSDLDELQRLNALDVYAAVGGLAAAGHLVRLFPPPGSHELELGGWCMAAESVPDARYLPLLEEQLESRNGALRPTYDRLKALVG
jgi:hypothetical protein